MNIPVDFGFTEAEGQGGLVKFIKMLQNLWRRLATVVNGNLDLTNLNGTVQSVNFPSANTDVTVTHNLGRIPIGYFVLTESAATSVYLGSVAATTTQITLRSSAAGVTVTLYIL